MAKAQQLAIQSHNLVSKIKGSHYASLRSQIVRSSLSIPANIAEGRSQRSDREFARFLNYALASSTELEIARPHVQGSEPHQRKRFQQDR
jgi:four helix bundle protein